VKCWNVFSESTCVMELLHGRSAPLYNTVQSFAFYLSIRFPRCQSSQDVEPFGITSYFSQFKKAPEESDEITLNQEVQLDIPMNFNGHNITNKCRVVKVVDQPLTKPQK